MATPDIDPSIIDKLVSEPNKPSDDDFDRWCDKSRFDEYIESMRCCSLRNIGKRIGKDFFVDEPADEIVFIDDDTEKVVKWIKRFDPLQFLLGRG